MAGAAVPDIRNDLSQTIEVPSHEALFQAPLERLLVEVPSDEHELVRAGLALPPEAIALGIPQFMHGVDDVTRVAAVVQDALDAVEVVVLLMREFPEPLEESLGVDGAAKRFRSEEHTSEL